MSRDRHAPLRPCRRCGVPILWNVKAKVPGVCNDCRQVDPAWVRALRPPAVTA